MRSSPNQPPAEANTGFKLCRTETEKEARSRSSKGVKPSVNSVIPLRVFLPSEKQRKAPRNVGAQETRRRKARTEFTERFLAVGISIVPPGHTGTATALNAEMSKLQCPFGSGARPFGSYDGR